MLRRIAVELATNPVFAALAFFGLNAIWFASPGAVAQTGIIWDDGRPMFPSDRGIGSPGGQPIWNYAPLEPPVGEPGLRGPADVVSGGPRPSVTAQAPSIVPFANNEAPGTVIIDTGSRKLYYTLSASQAYEYPISVGREGFAWTGVEAVSRIVDWPDWYPPAEMRERQPELPKRMTGGIRNPLGAKALYLGDTLYRIHGTNDAATIGQAASSGCFRMLNKHVVHLASLVQVGTVVKVVDRWREPPPAQVKSIPEEPVDQSAAAMARPPAKNAIR